MAEVERAGDDGARDSGRWRGDLLMTDGNWATADEGGGIGRRREPARAATGARARRREHARGGGSLNGGRRREHAPRRRGARPATGKKIICHY
jgi:hypothetical protein